MTQQTGSNTSDKIITITGPAIAEIKRLMAEEAADALYLRIGVSAGGCSGMSYHMAFDTEKSDRDRQFDYDGVTVLIDSLAAPYLEASTLDFKGGLLGGGFQFDNPNARRSCGCGSSFTC